MEPQPSGTTRAPRARSSRGERPAESPAEESPGARRKEPPALLEAGGAFTGLLASSGDVRVEGELEGEVVARGTCWIGEHARVKGNVEADELVLAGKLEGRAVVRRRLELLATARFEGSLQTPSVVLAEGAYLSGDCRAGSSSDADDEAVETPASSP